MQYTVSYNKGEDYRALIRHDEQIRLLLAALARREGAPFIATTDAIRFVNEPGNKALERSNMRKAHLAARKLARQRRAVVILICNYAIVVRTTSI